MKDKNYAYNSSKTAVDAQIYKLNKSAFNFKINELAYDLSKLIYTRPNGTNTFEMAYCLFLTSVWISTIIKDKSFRLNT